MPYSTNAGVALYYEIEGSGPPLCLINGYRLSGFTWPRAFIARLAARCTVIALDNRGAGRSDKPADGYEFANLANDVVALLDDLAWTLDPEPHDPLPRHTDASGASLGVPVGVFRRVGGVPAVASGEAMTSV